MTSSIFSCRSGILVTGPPARWLLGSRSTGQPPVLDNKRNQAASRSLLPCTSYAFYAGAVARVWRPDPCLVPCSLPADAPLAAWLQPVLLVAATWCADWYAVPHLAPNLLRRLAGRPLTVMPRTCPVACLSVRLKISQPCCLCNGSTVAAPGWLASAFPACCTAAKSCLMYLNRYHN